MSALVGATTMIRTGVFQNLSAAVEQVTQTGAERWQDAVQHAPLWKGERDAYAASIHWRMVSDYAGEIISDYKFVEDIETGRPAYDMKRMLDTSMKVRTSKKGRRYLIIPMRKNLDSMPSDIASAARALAPSRITGQGTRVSGTGAYDIKTRKLFMVRKNKYQWGEKLPAGMVPKLPGHKTDKYAGTYRFDTSSPSGAKSSSYLSFRVMAEGQAGWVLPAKAGLFIAQKMTMELQPLAERLFAAAVAQDTGTV